MDILKKKSDRRMDKKKWPRHEQKKKVTDAWKKEKMETDASDFRHFLLFLLSLYKNRRSFSIRPSQ